MEFIAHRRNTRSELHQTPTRHGVEVDIRSWGDRLIVHHDPFSEGESFDEWVTGYGHGTLILNVKEEGLEKRLIASMQEHGIDDYFFLDQSFPFLIKTAQAGERRCAVRVSEFESSETALALAEKIDWVWVDCFSTFPLDRAAWMRLTDAGLRLCLVSPDLLGRTDPAEILAQRAMLREWGVEPDAVCCKLEAIPVWERALDRVG